MKNVCELTLAEAQDLLALLAELPIKFLPIVQAVNQRLLAKFQDDALAPPSNGAAQTVL